MNPADAAVEFSARVFDDTGGFSYAANLGGQEGEDFNLDPGDAVSGIVAVDTSGIADPLASSKKSKSRTNFSGSDILSISTNDNGHTGGGALTDTVEGVMDPADCPNLGGHEGEPILTPWTCLTSWTMFLSSTPKTNSSTFRRIPHRDETH